MTTIVHGKYLLSQRTAERLLGVPLPLPVMPAKRQKPCALCGGTEIESPPWDKKGWACRPCWNGYVNFRRAFKVEHGRFPTFEEVMNEEP